MDYLNKLTYAHLFVGFLAALVKFPFLTLLVLHIVLEILIRTETGKNLAHQYLQQDLYTYLLDERNALASTAALFIGYLIGGFLKGCFRK